MAIRKISRASRGPGRPPLTQTQRVLNAVMRGGQDAKTIARMARVPELHVHPLLNRLRSYGLVEGYTGSLRATTSTTDASKTRSSRSGGRP